MENRTKEAQAAGPTRALKDYGGLLIVSAGVLIVAAGISAADPRPHMMMASIGVGFCLPTAMLTLWITQRMQARYPYGGLLGMTLGIMLRLSVALGGAAMIFWGVESFRSVALVYWIWVLFAYLSTLVVETLILARQFTAMGRGKTI